MSMTGIYTVWWENCRKGKMFQTYLMAQYKRIGKLFPAALAVTAALVCCLVLLYTALIRADAGQEKKQMVEIGLVGSTEGSYLGFGIQALQRLDSSRFAITFLEMESEEAAEKALERRELSAYVLIPDGFAEDLVKGVNTPVTYVTSAGAVGIDSMVMSELVETISVLITESQNAVYSTQRILREQGRQDSYRDAEERLCLRLLDLILGRETIYDLELTGVSGGLSMAEYETCGIAILFLLLWGIAATPFMAGRDAAVSRLLYVKGLSAGGQVLAEYVSWFVLSEVCFLGVTAPFASRIGGWILGMVPVVVVFAAMQLCIYEWVSDLVTGTLIQFLAAAGLGYLSGCFYPIAFFPAEIRALAPYLPTGAAMGYGRKLITGQAFWGELAVLGIYGVGGFLLTVLRRKRRFVR